MLGSGARKTPKWTPIRYCNSVSVIHHAVDRLGILAWYVVGVVVLSVKRSLRKQKTFEKRRMSRQYCPSLVKNHIKNLLMSIHGIVLTNTISCTSVRKNNGDVF